MKANRLPLAGIRVCDFSWWAAGPLLTKLLSAFGAEVIRIESTAKIDGLRLSPPVKSSRPDAVNASGYFNNYNSDKMSFGLNMSKPKGKEIVKRLIKISDLLVENYAGGVLDKWGLGDDELLKLHPGLIIVHMPILGLTGPHRNWLSFGGPLQGAAGLTYLCGTPDRAPVGVGAAYPDFSTSMTHGQIATVVALLNRLRSGKGQVVEVCQLEGAVHLTGTAVLEYSANKRIQERMGNRSAYAAPHGAYRCKGDDRWCAIAVFGDEEWQTFCRVMGKPGLAKDERFATLAKRKENEDELDRIVEEWTAGRTAEEVMLIMQQAGVGAGVVQNAEDELVRDPQLRSREYFAYLNHAELGRSAYDGLPYKLSATPWVMRKAAPLFGEHTVYVAEELLGMSVDEVSQCYSDGIFE